MDGKIVSNVISDVICTELKQFPDDRGAVLHMLRNDDPLFSTFGECYFSEVLPGAVKAWKLHRNQTQCFSVPVGRIKLVIYDSPKGSNSNGTVQSIILGRPDSYIRVMIPPGLWYGFTCVSEIPALLVNCTDTPHDPEENEIKAADDLSIPYKWS